MRRATIITLDRLLELRLVRWLGLLRRGRGLRLRAMQPTQSDCYQLSTCKPTLKGSETPTYNPPLPVNA